MQPNTPKALINPVSGNEQLPQTSPAAEPSPIAPSVVSLATTQPLSTPSPSFDWGRYDVPKTKLYDIPSSEQALDSISKTEPAYSSTPQPPPTSHLEIPYKKIWSSVGIGLVVILLIASASTLWSNYQNKGSTSDLKQGSLSSVDDQDKVLQRSRENNAIKINLDTKIQPKVNSLTALVLQNATGSNLLVADTKSGRVGIGLTPVASGPILQVAGDISSSQSLFAGGGLSSLNNEGLRINAVTICTANGCKALGSSNGPAGPPGPSGLNGTNGTPGPTGPTGPSGVASCPNGPCLSLQAASPGITETGNINISGIAIASSFSGNGANLSNVNAASLQGENLSYFTNASNISSGTLNNSRLNSNVTLAGNTFNGNSQLVQLTGGGLLPVLNGSNLTNVDAISLGGNSSSYFTNASNLASGTLNDLRLSANVSLLGISIDSSEITNDSITDADINSAAAISWSKLSKSGSSLADLATRSATDLSSGTLNDARLSSNVALLNGTGPQTFTGNNRFTGTVLAQNASNSTAAFQVQNAAGSTVLFNADTTNLTISIDANTTIAANRSLILAGGASFPSTPTEGQMFFRSDTKQLYIYANSKWQADRSASTLIVSASNSQNKEKADYVGDGTNDQNAIDSAINALPASGGSIYILEGTYNITGGIALNKDNVTLIGAGRNTILKRMFNESTANNSGIITITASGLTIQQVYLDGNKATYSNANNHGILSSSSRNNNKMLNIGVVNSAGDGIKVAFNILSTAATSTGWAISQSDISNNNGNGINFDRAAVAIDNNTVTGNGSIGITTGVSQQYANITNNYVASNANGISIGNSDQTIVGNTVTLNTSEGIIVGGTASRERKVVSGNAVSSNGSTGIRINGNGTTVSGNTVGLNSGNAIRLQGIDNIVNANYIYQNIGSGISTNGGSNSIVSNNMVHDNGGAGAVNGIDIGSGGSTNIQVLGNQITDTAGSGYAINLTSSASNITLSNNTFSGTGASTINDLGLGTIYNNQADNNGNINVRGQAGIGLNTAVSAYSLQNTGAFVQGGLSTPGAPGVTVQGVAGVTTWGYRVTAYDGLGETLASTETQVSTGNATLNSSNFNRIVPVRVNGAISYKIYRTTAGGSPATTGLVGTLGGGSNSFQFDDTGIAASGNVPTVNATGTTQLQGYSVLVKSASDSTTAFQIQNAAGTSNLFIADTANTRVGIGATPASSLLTIGTNTTTAAGGVIFGTDTNLYRSGADTLRTDDSLFVAAQMRADSVQIGLSSANGLWSASGTLDLLAGSGIRFGASSDTNLYRLAADRLKTDDNFEIGQDTRGTGDIFAGYGLANQIRLSVGTGPKISIGDTSAGVSTQAAIGAVGPGNAAGITLGVSGAYNDTNLYRAAADVLKTDDNFSIQTAINSTTAFQLQNSSGTSLLSASTSDMNILVSGDLKTTVASATTAVTQSINVITIGGATSYWTPNMTLGTDGYPWIAFYDPSGGADLRLIKCGNVTCTSGNILRTLDSTNNVGRYPSIKLGKDGFPVISYWDATAGDLKVAKCLDGTCSSSTITTADTGGAADVGYYTSLAVPADGLPVIAYHDITNNQLKVYKCSNASCTAGTATSQAVDGLHPSLAIGTDGLPIISHRDNGARVTKCNDASCTSRTTTMVDASVNPYQATAITIGRDGLPIFAYGNTSVMKVAKCGNAACSSGNVLTTIGSVAQQYGTSIANTSDGNPLVFYQDGGTGDSKAYKCSNLACTTGTTTVVEPPVSGTDYSSSMTFTSDGLPLIAYSVVNSNVRLVKCANIACSSTNGIALTVGNNFGSSATPIKSLYFDTLNFGRADARVSLNDQGNFFANSLQAGSNGTVSVNTNSTNAFQIQNSSSANLFSADTSGMNLTLNGANNGELSAWSTESDTLPLNRKEHSSVTANGYIYVLGGYNSTFADAGATVYYAKLNADGSTGSWSTTTAFPDERWSHSSVVVNGYVYVIGGRDDAGTDQETVYYAKLNADGTVGTWATTTVPGTQIGYQQSAITYNGYIYITGGNSTNLAVYYAKVGADGKLGAWTTSGNSLPSAASKHSAVVGNGYAYVVGGPDPATTQVFYAKLNSDGTTGTWASTSSLPAARLQFSAVVSNGYIYALGGPDTPTNIVFYTKLNNDGTVGAWQTNTTTLPATRRLHTSVVANGYVYVLGGDGVNTVYYASTSRIKIGGSVDLVGISGGDLTVNNGGGGSLTAGNTQVVGTLQVQDAATFANSISVDKELTVRGSALFQNSTNSTTALQVQSSSGTSFLVADSTNKRITIGDGATNSPLVVTAATGNSFITFTPGGADNSANSAYLNVNNGRSLFGYDGANNVAVVRGGTSKGVYILTNDTTVAANFGNNGSVLFKNGTDSATAFQVQNNAAASILSVDTTTNNLITNGSFEVDTSGWSSKISLSVGIVRQTTFAQNGGASVSMTTSATAGSGIRYSSYALSSNTMYTFSAYVRSVSGTVASNTIVLGYQNTANQVDTTGDNDCASSPAIGNGWTYISCTFTTGTVSGGGIIYLKQIDATARGLFVDSAQLVLYSRLSNPSIEQAISGNWAAKNSATVTQDATQSYIGSNSLKIVTTTASTDGARQNITLTNSAIYSLTFYAKLDGASAALTTMQAGYSSDGSTDGNVCIDNQTVVTTGWTQYSCTLLTPASNSGTPFIYVKHNSATAHTFYLDSLQLIQGRPNTNYQDGRITLNGILSSPLTLQANNDSTTAFQVQNSGGSSLFTIDTTNNMITLGTASSTPVLLVLGNKNTSGDPTCTTGAIYYNSNSNQFRACQNGAWGGLALTPSYTGTLPGSPYDGQEIYYQADASNGVIWHLRYNAGSASSYKWEYLGGAALLNEDSTGGTTSSTSYVDVGTAPQVTIPRSGEYVITLYAEVGPNSANQALSQYQVRITAKLGTAAASDSDGTMLQDETATETRGGINRTIVRTLAASDVIKLQGRVNQGSGTMQRSGLMIVPKRIN